MKNFYFLLLAVCFSYSLNAQIINFPDPNLKRILLSAGVSQVASAEEPNADWTINSFVPIDTNFDEEIQVSEATAIKCLQLYCYDDPVFSDLTGLEYFTNLKVLNIRWSHIQTLDLSPFPNLLKLDCNTNNITSLNLSVAPNLRHVECKWNALSVGGLNELNVAGLSQLQYLDCSECYGIHTLDLTGLTQLETLNCSGNIYLQTIDFSGLPNLRNLNCGRISALSPTVLSTLTPDLTSLVCGSNYWTTIDLSGLPHLKYLSCSDNVLSSLDLSELPELVSLFCDLNWLTTINLSGLSQLQEINCNDNYLTSLDLSNLSHLSTVYCSRNDINTLNLDGLLNLEMLECQVNQLSALNLDGLSNLLALYCYNNQLQELSVNEFPNLHELNCSNNQLQELAIKNGSQETVLQFSGNPGLTHICADAFQTEAVQAQALIYGYDCLVYSDCSLANEDFVSATTLKVYPNPVQNLLYFSSAEVLKIASCSVYNTLGQLVFVVTNPNLTIDVSSLKTGTYFISIVSDKGTANNRFLKQ